MNSSARSLRRIASNLLWTPEGWVRNPLLTLTAGGRVVRAAVCEAPDREPFVEFYSGVLVPGFPEDYRTVFARLLERAERPLHDLLHDLRIEAASGAGGPAPEEDGGPVARVVPAGVPGLLVVISGLDYATMRLTARSRIRAVATDGNAMRA